MSSWNALNIARAVESLSQLSTGLASKTDAAVNAAGSGKFASSGTATLWGKVIPLTYGKRRITGQPLQAGVMRQSTDTSIVWKGSAVTGGATYQGNTYYTTRRTATFAYVFGAPGNPDSKLLLMRLWLNGTKIYDATTGERQSGLNLGLFSGSEDQLADATLNQERYDQPVAYRGLIYVVFYDYVVPSGDSAEVQLSTNINFTPEIEAEFWEEVTNPVTTIQFVDADGSTPSDFIIASGFDARRGRFYSVSDTDSLMYCFDVATGHLIQKPAITGIPASGVSISGTAVGFYVEAGIPWMIVTKSASNSRPVYLVNADTGVAVDSIGVDSNSLTPDSTHIGGISNAPCAAVGMTTEIAIINIFGYLQILVATGGQLTYRVTGALFDADATPFYLKGADWRVCHDNFIKLIDGTVEYTGTYDIQMVFQTSNFDDLIIFENNAGTSPWRIYRVTRAGVIKWEYNDVTHPSIDFNGGSDFAWKHQSNTGGQNIGWQVGTTAYVLNFLSGTIDIITDRATIGSRIPVYDDYLRTLIDYGTTNESHPIYNGTTDNITLSSLLINLAERQGYATSDIVVDGIADTIIGAAITEVSNIETILSDIALAYNFQIVKRGRKIIFTRRTLGSSFIPDGTITEADRVILEEVDGAYITVKSERANVDKAAGTVVINFIDPDLKYVVNTIQHSRNDSQANLSQKLTLNLPIIMTASSAATLAARVIVNATEGRMEHEFLLSQKFTRVEVGDYYELELPEYTDMVKLTEVDYNADYSILCKAEAVSTRIGPSITMDSYIVFDDAPSLFNEAKPILFDTPLLHAIDQASGDRLEVYLSLVPAARGSANSGSIGRSFDPSGFITVGSTNDSLLYGFINSGLSDFNSLEAWSYHEFDSFSARIVQGDTSLFVNATYENMLAGSNRLLVGQQGRWEFVAFTTVVYDPDTKIATFSGLVKGLRGTDPNIANHTVSDYVVFYTGDSSVLDTSVEASHLDDEVFYISYNGFGGFITQDILVTEADGNARKPWAVQNVTCVDVAGDVEITWTRRTRLNGPLVDGTGDVPLDEVTESYQLDIYLSGVIVRTVTGVTSELYTYTAAQQSADGWPGAITSLEVDIYQISAIVGRGFGKAGTYDVE